MALDRIITMQIVTFDDVGTETARVSHRVWAEVLDGGTSEFLSGGGLRVEQRLNITIRWSSIFAGIPPTRLFVVVDGVEHDVLNINDFQERRRLLTMQTIAEVSGL